MKCGEMPTSAARVVHLFQMLLDKNRPLQCALGSLLSLLTIAPLGILSRDLLLFDTDEHLREKITLQLLP